MEKAKKLTLKKEVVTLLTTEMRTIYGKGGENTNEVLQTLLITEGGECDSGGTGSNAPDCTKFVVTRDMPCPSDEGTCACWATAGFACDPHLTLIEGPGCPGTRNC